MNEQMKEHFNASLQNSYNPAYTLHHKNECRVACMKEHFNASLQNSYNPAYTLHHKNECRVALKCSFMHATRHSFLWCSVYAGL